nr:ImmA/IrrE family metallo-endopeptidase [Tumebacillus amylolyticus]
MIRFPIEDVSISAFTMRRKSKDYVYLNTWLPLDMQIFAAAHEWYHICHDAEYQRQKNDLVENLQQTYDNGILREKIANCFAACLLVPSHQLHKELLALELDKDKIRARDVLKLMDAFAVPFHAMVLRLYENGFLKPEQAEEFLALPENDPNSGVLPLVKKTGHAKRWKRVDPEVEYSCLVDLLLQNFERNFVSYDGVEKVFKELNVPLEDYLKLEEDL